MTTNDLTIAPSLLRTILLILWALLALLLRDTLPALFWFTMVTLPIFALYRTQRDYLHSPACRPILYLCLATFAIHTLKAWITSAHYSPGTTVTYWRDDMNYYKEAIAIAHAWKSDLFPDLTLKGSQDYFLGTLHTGYHRPLSAAFYGFGPSIFAGLMINTICLTFMPVLAALSARFIWQKDLTNNNGTNNIGLIAAALTALHPAQYYWSSFLIKDVFTSLTVLTCLTTLLGTFRLKSTDLLISSLLLIPYTFSVRAYAALSLILGSLCIPLLKIPRRQIYSLLITILLLLYLLCSYTHTGNVISRQLRDSFLALGSTGLNNPLQLLKHILAGIPKLFMAPYAWLIFPKPMSLYGLYPAMWYLYLIIYPLGFVGLITAIRRNISLSVLPLAICGIAALLFLSASYGGIAPRQRYYIEYIFILFAAYGYQHKSKTIISIILSLQLLFAIGQVLNLPQ